MTEVDDIMIEVDRSCMDVNRFTVSAYYKKDSSIPYHNRIYGYSYADCGFLLRVFAIGDSFETKLKRATCEAIEDLKLKYACYIAKRDFMESLNKQAQSYVKQCVEKEHE